MKKLLLLLFLITSSLFGVNECVECHKGIEDIRDRESNMMKAILKIADKAGHKGNDCIVCHGGNPFNKSKEYGHKGTVKYFKNHDGPKTFYPSPTSPSININTCGMCHPDQIDSQKNSLMSLASGKIQGAMWNFDLNDTNEHQFATYDAENPDDTDYRLGTDIYREYMQKLSTMEPQVFPNVQHPLPDAPTTEEIHKNPSLAVFTYLRQECMSCHTNSKGNSKRDGYRGVGCSSCHIPYSNDGFYKGNDIRIKKKESGHLLTHQIQSSRKVKVNVEGINYSGIPVSACATCHSQGKRIATSYQGLMEPQYKSTHYLQMQEDVHFKKGMLCQDCHTSNDLHGDGFISGSNLASVEIECQDCHGTTKKYPWELPFGYSDEFNTTEASGDKRGVVQDVAEYLKQGFIPQDKHDGFILSARGNPLPKVVKKGNKILIHLANGKDIELKPLKFLKKNKKLSKKALTAMDKIDAHTSRLECYACHATWAPQYYGRHVEIDYSKNKKNIDYLKASQDSDRKKLKKYLIDAKVTQTNDFIRWEDPALAQNGEGRITPAVPSYETSISIIGKDSKVLLENYKDKNTTKLASIQPHTITKKSRSCESCHASDKAMGFGISGIKHNNSYDKNSTKTIEDKYHFKLSQPLDEVQRSKLDRRGMCLACHVSIPDGDLAVSMMTHAAEMLELKIDKKMHASILNKALKIGAWTQIVSLLFLMLIISVFVYYKFIKKKPINPRNEGWK